LVVNAILPSGKPALLIPIIKTQLDQADYTGQADAGKNQLLIPFVVRSSNCSLFLGKRLASASGQSDLRGTQVDEKSCH
jgi:hypothetical protein